MNMNILYCRIYPSKLFINSTNISVMISFTENDVAYVIIGCTVAAFVLIILVIIGLCLFLSYRRGENVCGCCNRYTRSIKTYSTLLHFLSKIFSDIFCSRENPFLIINIHFLVTKVCPQVVSIRCSLKASVLIRI